MYHKNLLKKNKKKSVVVHYLIILKSWFLLTLRRLRIMLNPEHKSLYNIIQDLEIRYDEIPVREQNLLSNFLKCYKKSLEEIMIPRSDITAIKLPVTIEKLKLILHNLPTCILVYENNLDTILGFVHVRDLLTVILNNQDLNLSSILQQPIIAAPSMNPIDLLDIMQRKNVNIAIVIDEYGGTDGIVTSSDIVGKIFEGIHEDNSSNCDVRPEFMYQVIDQNTIITNARVKIETLEKITGITLKHEEDECNTIGGLVLGRIGYMPSAGFIIDINEHIKAEIIEATPRILKQIKLVIQDTNQSNII